MKKQRDNNIEVLRCAMMLVIVLGHMAGMGRYAGDKAVHAIFTLVYFATSAFVFISGWYGIRFAWDKVWKLLGIGLFASVVNSLLSKFALGHWDWHFSMGWFGNSYLALLLLSPLVNAGIKSLYESSPAALYSAWLACAVAGLMSWLPLGCRIDIVPAGWLGNSVLAIFFVYFTGRVVALSAWVRKVDARKASLWLLSLLIVNVLWSFMAMLGHDNPFLSALFIGTRGGNAPLTIAIALWTFLFFKTIRMPQWLGRACAYIAPCMLSVYLLHLGSFEDVAKALWCRYAFVGATSTVGKVLSTILAASIVFFVCVAIDLLRGGVLQLLRRIADKCHS